MLAKSVHEIHSGRSSCLLTSLNQVRIGMKFTPSLIFKPEQMKLMVMQECVPIL